MSSARKHRHRHRLHPAASAEHQFRRRLSAGFDRKGEGRGVFRRADAHGGVEGKWRAAATGGDDMTDPTRYRLPAPIYRSEQAASLQPLRDAPGSVDDHPSRTMPMFPTARKRSKARRLQRIGVSLCISVLAITRLGTKGYLSFKFPRLTDIGEGYRIGPKYQSMNLGTGWLGAPRPEGVGLMGACKLWFGSVFLT